MKQPLYITLWFFCCISFVTAQPTDYSVRQNFALSLQIAKNQVKDLTENNSSSVPPANFAHDAMKFLDFDGLCKTLISNEVKFFGPVTTVNLITNETIKSDYMTLKVLRRPATNNLDVLPGSDRMVCDLNGWLMFSWGAVVHKDSLGGKNGNHRIGEASSCKNGNQNYYMGRAAISGQINDALHILLDGDNMEWLGNDDKNYPIMKNDGTPITVSGDNLFNFPRQNSTTDNIHYIGTYKPGINGSRDTGLAKVAYSYIEFKDYYNSFISDVAINGFPDNEPKKVLLSIEISAHTAIYNNDCSITGYGLNTGTPIPETYAGVDMIIRYMNYDLNPPQELTVTCSYDFNDLTNPDEANDTLWKYFGFFDPSKWYNPNYPLINRWARFDIDKHGYIKLYVYGQSLDESFYVMRVRNRATPAEYCEVKIPREGTFSVDNMTGEIIYTDNQNVVYPIPCLEFCKKISGHRTVDGVIASSAVKLNDAWDKENLSFRTTRVLDTWYAENRSNNAYETGARGHWRPEATFAYKTNIRGATGSSERIYSDAGVYLNDQGNIFDAFRIYDWRNPSANTATKWLQLNQVTITSPYGEPLEEKDILGIYSSAKFSHKNTVPKMVARNAPYSSIEFQSFEDWSTNVTNDYAHSGRYSLELSTDFNGNPVLATILPINQTAPSIPNFLLSVWVKQNYPSNPNSLIPIESSLGSQVSFKKIAQTGEWTLYEAEASIPPSQPNTKIEIKLKKIISEKVWIDDFKIQPLESEATCYAYDPVALKLAAQFDDRHFGVFYQYNSEGKLIRKLRETERGLKTVTETQYHTPLPYYRDGSPAPMAFSGPNQPSFGIQSSGNNLPDIPNGPINGVRPPSGGVSADVDILNLEVGPQGYDLSVFGSQTLPDWDSFTRWFSDSLSGGDLMQGIDIPSLDSLQFPAIPAVEQVQALQEIKETENSIAETVEQANNQSSDSARQQLMLRAAELRKRRQELIEQRLGISEQEFREFVERNRVREDEEKSNEESDDQEHQPKGEEE